MRCFAATTTSADTTTTVRGAGALLSAASAPLRAASAARAALAQGALTGLISMLAVAPVFGQTAAARSAARARDAPPFQVEEATIADLHRAIQQGRTTCTAVVRAYVERARAYNGACTQLVTSTGAPVPAVPGSVRAGAPLTFPTATVPASSVLPRFAEYAGLPIDYGRMEPTRSDPAAFQQYGMVVGIPNAGQVNALSTLNLRGERSVTCKGDFDKATGPLPGSAPAACEAFRKQPDALERAAQLDAQYGRNPDLKKLPMYCVVMSFKDVYDTADMRTTGGADTAYAMDAPPKDSTIVSALRSKGAIIYAKANLAEYNGGSGNPGGAAKPTRREFGAGSRSSWAGTACNPYSTDRETGGSSSGSAAAVGANLSACSVCEETGGSCRQPAWRNGVVALVTTKGLMPYGGAIGADPFLDRAGVHCKSVTDAAIVLDAMRDAQRGYFDPRDIYSALPKALISKAPYASYTTDAAKTPGGKPLAGLRVGIVREYMVKHSANDVTMSDQVDREIKTVLRDRLGAELVETVDPLYQDDPDVPNDAYTFQQALAEILPFHMPELLQKKEADGTPTYAVAGFDVTLRDYMVKAAEGLAPWPSGLNMRSINNGPPSASFGFHLAQYLLRRGDTAVTDWATLNGRSKYFTETRANAMKNWEGKVDLVSEGITQDVKMREVMRLVVEKVMQQNRIDVLVNPTTTVPPSRIGYASQPVVNSRTLGRFPTSANLGIPEITVPAGFNRVVYEPSFALNPARDSYTSVANEATPSRLDAALPVGISFWAGIGEEPVLIKVASAYESATKHRTPPPAFGPPSARPKAPAPRPTTTQTSTATANQ